MPEGRRHYHRLQCRRHLLVFGHFAELELTIESDARDWVVYTEPEQAICVEPQTAPPGALDVDAALVEPGAPLITTMTWSWRSLEG